MYTSATRIQTKLPAFVKAELRASHAGETGAVWIYRGILAANWLVRDRAVIAFSQQHLVTEKQHLEAFERNIHLYRGSFLLMLWVIAGFITGFLPALLGRNWVFYTIYCVESFVDRHYTQQIRLLSKHGDNSYADIIHLFKQCNKDEIAHKKEALLRISETTSWPMLSWGKAVRAGSQLAVLLAKRI